MSYTELYPKTFSLLYCPFDSECDSDEPTDNPYTMLNHLKEVHNLNIPEPEACFPFFDRYLRSLPERAHLSPQDFDRLDVCIRIRLQTDRLKNILETQERERHTLYIRPTPCLFCDFVGRELPVTFQHMFLHHKFNIGQLENLVMVPSFLLLLQKKLAEGVCLFCEHPFPSQDELLRHMRMKQHFKIHPKNHIYDQFYISNYVTVKNAGQDAEEEAEDDTWDDLDELEDTKTSCVFCPLVLPTPDDVFQHIIEVHKYDLAAVLKDLSLEERFQYINCLRYHQHHLKCVNCPLDFEDETQWQQHYDQENHFICTTWREPQYFFPAFNENDDPLLYSLDFED